MLESELQNGNAVGSAAPKDVKRLFCSPVPDFAGVGAIGVFFAGWLAQFPGPVQTGRPVMTRSSQISIVKTAQMADTLKLVLDGRVIGSVEVVDDATARLRDHRERLLGTYPDAATAVAAFEKLIGFEEIDLDT